MRKVARNSRLTSVLPLFCGSSLQPALAGPVEGDFGSRAAALLMLLGIGALLLSIRNLRKLRYKPMVPLRQQRQTDDVEDRDE